MTIPFGTLTVPARWVKAGRGSRFERWQTLLLAGYPAATLDYGIDRDGKSKGRVNYRVSITHNVGSSSVRVPTLDDAVALIAAEIGSTYEALMALPGAPEKP